MVVSGEGSGEATEVGSVVVTEVGSAVAVAAASEAGTAAAAASGTATILEVADAGASVAAGATGMHATPTSLCL